MEMILQSVEKKGQSVLYPLLLWILQILLRSNTDLLSLFIYLVEEILLCLQQIIPPSWVSWHEEVGNDDTQMFKVEAELAGNPKQGDPHGEGCSVSLERGQVGKELRKASQPRPAHSVDTNHPGPEASFKRRHGVKRHESFPPNCCLL